MKQSKDNIINLEDFRVKRGNIVSKVFTGRDRGVYVRENSHIDDIDSKYETIFPKISNLSTPHFLRSYSEMLSQNMVGMSL